MVKLFSVGRRETHPTLGTWVGKVVLILEDDPGISCGYNKSHDFGFFFFFTRDTNKKTIVQPIFFLIIRN